MVPAKRNKTRGGGGTGGANRGDGEYSEAVRGWLQTGQEVRGAVGKQATQNLGKKRRLRGMASGWGGAKDL